MKPSLEVPSGTAIFLDYWDQGYTFVIERERETDRDRQRDRERERERERECVCVIKASIPKLTARQRVEAVVVDVVEVSLSQ